MIVARSVAEVRDLVSSERKQRNTIGFVPTMGALHAGHMSLVRLAKDATDIVVMSIFVNPLQFGPNEDFERYPRTEEADLAMAQAEGADIVFLPNVQEMYPAGATTTIHMTGLTDVLEGAHRPGHFDGVATVVAKLFNIVQPDLAFFGQKDAQQVAVIRKMVADLDIPVQVVVGDTVREPDGLALSSRNRYLSETERTRALALYLALEAGAAALRAGEAPSAAEQAMAGILDGEVEVDYAVAVDPDTFSGAPAGDVLLAIAGRVGATRLIDNMLVRSSERGTA
ncbi:MAG: pantoate--beta-alanine ligase [Actinomycetota bacterium]